jgi:hypothetical protein
MKTRSWARIQLFWFWFIESGYDKQGGDNARVERGAPGREKESESCRIYSLFVLLIRSGTASHIYIRGDYLMPTKTLT